MLQVKKLPIGISDFKELIEEGYYYLDKTMLIDELKRTNGKVILMPRPRRFGKTLNLSMIKYFFEKTESSNEHLFNNSLIWHHEKYRNLQGQFPVIFLSLRTVKASNWPLAYEQLIEVIVTEFKRHEKQLIPVLTSHDFNDYQTILTRSASKATFGNSLLFLTELLYRLHKKRVFISD